MNTSIDTDKLLMWANDGRVVTADVRKEGDGYSCEWWVSGNFGGSLQVMAVMNFPIYGLNEDEARQRAGFLLEDVLYIAKTFYGGDGEVGNIIPNSKKRVALAMMHLAGHWRDMSVGLSTIERTAEEYKFLKQFGISNVAQIIANLEGVASVRTIHERIFLAKQKKFI
jgi:hypothetical protein